VAITTSGIGSNLDIEGLIGQLMSFESRPLTLLAQKQASYETKLSAYSMVQSALSSFQSTMSNLSVVGRYMGVSSSVADSSVASASAQSTAASGKYSLEVLQLASNQRLTSGGVASNKSTIGTGTINIEFGTISGGTLDEDTGKYDGASFTPNSGGAKQITIDSSNNTLEGIRDAINKAGVGVTASIVNTGEANNPYRLVLASNETGETKSMKITVAGSSALSDLLTYDPEATQNMEQKSAAKNAEFIIDGVKFFKTSNTVSDAIDGLTINLLKTNAGSSTSINVSRDTSGVKSAVDAFVKAFNDLNTQLNNLTAYDADKKQASALTGDSAIRSIQTQIRNMLTKSVAGGLSGYRTLSDIGVSFQKDGSLAVDSAKLDKAIAGNANAVVALLAEGGTSSNSLVTYVSQTSNTLPGTYNVHITQAAKQGSVTLDVNDLDLTDTVTVDPDTLEETVTEKNTTMQVNLNGKNVSITLEKKVYANNQELAAELEKKINVAGAASGSSVKVAVDPDDGTLKITSTTYGSVSAVDLTDNAGIFGNKIVENGLDVQGTINGQAAIGSGQFLTGATGGAQGLKVQITAETVDATGLDAVVNYSQGQAFHINKLAQEMLGDKGSITSRIKGAETSLKGVAADQERLIQRLTAIEERYRRQFTSLDVLLGKMNATSNYLTQQLSALSGLYAKK